MKLIYETLERHIDHTIRYSINYPDQDLLIRAVGDEDYSEPDRISIFIGRKKQLTIIYNLHDDSVAYAFGEDPITGNYISGKAVVNGYHKKIEQAVNIWYNRRDLD